MGMQLFWAHPMELQGDMDEMEGQFSPFGDSVNLDATVYAKHNIGLEIILGATDGTPM
jgi:hypothetical protein